MVVVVLCSGLPLSVVAVRMALMTIVATMRVIISAMMRYIAMFLVSWLSTIFACSSSVAHSNLLVDSVSLVVASAIVTPAIAAAVAVAFVACWMMFLKLATLSVRGDFLSSYTSPSDRFCSMSLLSFLDIVVVDAFSGTLVISSSMLLMAFITAVSTPSSCGSSL